MKSRRLVLMLMLLFCLAAASTASAASAVWLGPAGGGAWNGFMQVIMQQEYRQQMNNGNPYWNTMMMPVSADSATNGMSSYMGMPAFGFCPAPGQCYMVMVQRPLASSSMANCPPPPAPGQQPNQQGKPNSLW